MILVVAKGAPIECSKRVYLCSRMYGCIVGVGDERKNLISSFVAWIIVSGNLMLEGLVSAFGEAICLWMVRGRKHLLDT